MLLGPYRVQFWATTVRTLKHGPDIRYCLAGHAFDDLEKSAYLGVPDPPSIHSFIQILEKQLTR